MDPAQTILAVVEISLLLLGSFLLLRALRSPERRQSWFGTNRIPHWPLTGHEVTLLLVLIFLCGFAGQSFAVWLFHNVLKGSDDRSGLEVVIYGAAFHGCALLGWLLFRMLRRWLYTDYGTLPAAEGPSPRLPLGVLFGTAAIALMVALPVLTVVSKGWEVVLTWLGLPGEPQDLIDIFSKTTSPFVIGGMLVVACVLAPINEELIFRAGLFRFLRQRFGRRAAFVVSGASFGALHGNWAGFVPLALLGVVLGLVYEKTGDIRVPIAVHALFNLNTVLVILSGLPNL